MVSILILECVPVNRYKGIKLVFTNKPNNHTIYNKTNYIYYTVAIVFLKTYHKNNNLKFEFIKIENNRRWGAISNSLPPEN